MSAGSLTEEEAKRSRRWTRMEEATKAITDGVPHAWIQWKGTNVCMDVYCSCGAHGHVDEEFAYRYRCLGCGKLFDVCGNIRLVEVPPEDVMDDDRRNVCVTEDESIARDLELKAKGIEPPNWSTAGQGAKPPHETKACTTYLGAPALRPHTIPGWWQVWSGTVCIALLRPEDVAVIYDDGYATGQREMIDGGGP